MTLGQKEKNSIFFRYLRKPRNSIKSKYLIYGMRLTFMCKYLVTLATLIWFLPKMCPHVILKFTFQSKTLTTFAALIRLSPVCVVIWHVICPFYEKDFLHWGHWYDFSLMCLIMCFVRELLCVKKPCHSGHIDMVSPQYVSLYAF